MKMTFSERLLSVLGGISLVFGVLFFFVSYFGFSQKLICDRVAQKPVECVIKTSWFGMEFSSSSKTFWLRNASLEQSSGWYEISLKKADDIVSEDTIVTLGYNPDAKLQQKKVDRINSFLKHPKEKSFIITVSNSSVIYYLPCVLITIGFISLGKKKLMPIISHLKSTKGTATGVCILILILTLYAFDIIPFIPIFPATLFLLILARYA